MNDFLNEATSSMTEQSKKDPCFAKLEFKALQYEIEALLKQCGGSRWTAYCVLFDSGRLTMAYSTFCHYTSGDTARIPGIDDMEPPDLVDEIHNLKELDFDGPGSELGHDRQSIYDNLVGLGAVGLGYSDFCDYFRESDF